MADTRFHMSVEPCAIVQAESWPGSTVGFEAELSRQLGGVLPSAFGEAVPLAGWQAIRIAPRRLWFIADAGAQLTCAVDPDLGCLLPLSEGRMRLRLRGSRTFDILAACVAIDWHAPDARPGRAVQTGFHRVPVLALRTATDACDLLVPRSFEHSLADWVADVASSHAAPQPAAVTA